MKKTVLWILAIGVAAVALYFAIPKDPGQAIGSVNKMAIDLLNREIDLEFFEALAMGDLAEARDAIDRGADVDALLREGVQEARTPLMLVAPRYVEGVRFLLDAGADPNVRTKDGTTALHLACMQGEVEIVLLLLEAGADPSIRTKAGATARSIAEDSGNEALLALFDDPATDGS